MIGPGETAAGRGHDDGEAGRDEQGVAQAPAGAETDNAADRVRRAGERGEHDDEDQADDQCALGADAAGYPTDYQHRDCGHDQIAGEQQRHLTRRGVEAAGQRGQDRIDQPDTHERDDTGERHGPDGTRLLEWARGRPM
jgi:hypothetical protein